MTLEKFYQELHLATAALELQQARERASPQAAAASGGVDGLSMRHRAEAEMLTANLAQNLRRLQDRQLQWDRCEERRLYRAQHPLPGAAAAPAHASRWAAWEAWLQEQSDAVADAVARTPGAAAAVQAAQQGAAAAAAPAAQAAAQAAAAAAVAQQAAAAAAPQPAAPVRGTKRAGTNVEALGTPPRTWFGFNQHFPVGAEPAAPGDIEMQ